MAQERWKRETGRKTERNTQNWDMSWILPHHAIVLLKLFLGFEITPYAPTTPSQYDFQPQQHSQGILLSKAHTESTEVFSFRRRGSFLEMNETFPSPLMLHLRSKQARSWYFGAQKALWLLLVPIDKYSLSSVLIADERKHWCWDRCPTFTLAINSIASCSPTECSIWRFSPTIESSKITDGYILVSCYPNISLGKVDCLNVGSNSKKCCCWRFWQLCRSSSLAYCHHDLQNVSQYAGIGLALRLMSLNANIDHARFYRLRLLQTSQTRLLAMSDTYLGDMPLCIHSDGQYWQ